MDDIKCPYCGTDQNIDHDDGYGYEEDVEYEQGCMECGKEFNYTTSVSYNYNVECKSGDHVMIPFGDKWPGMYECRNCDFYEKRGPE